MQLFRHRVFATGLLLLFVATLGAGLAFAAPRPGQGGWGSGSGGRSPGNRSGSQTPTIQGTITAVNATAGTLQVTDRNGLSITLGTSAATQITRSGATVTLAALQVNDSVQVTYDRTTLIASRIMATPPPPVQFTGTITALNVTTGAVGITTDHGTAITLTANASTRVSLNGRLTTLASMALGDRATVSYRTSDRILLTLSAVTPALDVVSGAITQLNVAGGTLQLTPRVGAARSIPLNAQTEYRLNGRRVASSTIAVGQLASVRLNSAGVATLVSAETPPLVDLQGTLTAIDTAAGTITITTASLTTITLRLTSTTSIQRNGVTATAAQLVAGDRVTVRYEFRLLPGTSVALLISAASTP